MRRVCVRVCAAPRPAGSQDTHTQTQPSVEGWIEECVLVVVAKQTAAAVVLCIAVVVVVF